MTRKRKVTEMQHTGLFFPDPATDIEAEAFLKKISLSNAALGSSIARMQNSGLSAKQLIDRLEVEGLIGIVRETNATEEEADALDFEMQMQERYVIV